MKLRWMWRWCPCATCALRRRPPIGVNMPKLLAYLLEEGFDIRPAEIMREDIAQTLGHTYIPNTRMQIPTVNATELYRERRSYSYGPKP